MGIQYTRVEYNTMIESERKSIIISHDDFAIDFDFDNEQDIIDVNQFLIDKNVWEQHLNYSQTRKCNDVNTRVANEIFLEVYTNFNKKLDAVVLFDIITTFYNFNPSEYYNRLVQKFRTILLKDLSNKIGEVDVYKEQQIDGMLQKTFASLFKK